MKFTNLGLEEQDVANACERHPFVGEPSDLLHQMNLATGVATLASIGPRRLDDRLGVQPAKEGRLDTEHVGNLSYGEQWGVLIVEGVRLVLGSSG